ncbi:hypothetical protein WICPIJ_007191 [Wickerhamomyces pijperi]|uniref:Kinetochore protein SPC25 n=1 Tax=Wickerhamomyces pijperi TaxID=599730 RepID=A0A9P8Q2B8_WICPI|nr:hypothetical protein WICPIJ_007191 [Wickerhamomyces pijperi]
MSTQHQGESDIELALKTLQDRFGSFVKTQRRQVQQAHIEHTQQIKDLRTQLKAIEENIEELEVLETQLLKELETNNEELQQTESRLAADRTRYAEIEEERKYLQRQHDEFEDKLQSRRAELIQAKLEKDQQNDQNLPEVELYERLLGIKIESIALDILKITLTNIDSAVPEKQYSITLDISEEEYKITESTPEVHESEEVQGFLTLLNDDGNIVLFLKRVRIVFKTL